MKLSNNPDKRYKLNIAVLIVVVIVAICTSGYYFGKIISKNYYTKKTLELFYLPRFQKDTQQYKKGAPGKEALISSLDVKYSFDGMIKVFNKLDRSWKRSNEDKKNFKGSLHFIKGTIFRPDLLSIKPKQIYNAIVSELDKIGAIDNREELFTAIRNERVIETLGYKMYFTDKQFSSVEEYIELVNSVIEELKKEPSFPYVLEYVNKLLEPYNKDDLPLPSVSNPDFRFLPELIDSYEKAKEENYFYFAVIDAHNYASEAVSQKKDF